jgi:hypothetical protein
MSRLGSDRHVRLFDQVFSQALLRRRVGLRRVELVHREVLSNFIV